MSVFNKGMKDYDCLCFIILEISFVDICDFEDQITFHDQFEQNIVNSSLTLCCNYSCKNKTKQK